MLLDLGGMHSAVYGYNTLSVPRLRGGTGVALIDTADVIRNKTRSILLARGGSCTAGEWL